MTEYQKNYNEKNKDKIREYQKEYKKLNREAINQYQIDRRNYQLDYKLSCNLAKRIYLALKGNTKYKTTLEYIGCSIQELKKYLENKFVAGMDWNNYGSEWHIDHVKPCSKFDLSKVDEQDICFNFKNLQPLWAIDNRKKHNKYDEGSINQL